MAKNVIATKRSVSKTVSKAKTVVKSISKTAVSKTAVSKRAPVKAKATSKPASSTSKLVKVAKPNYILGNNVAQMLLNSAPARKVVAVATPVVDSVVDYVKPMAEQVSGTVTSNVNKIVKSAKANVIANFNPANNARVMQVADGATKVMYAGVGAVARAQSEGEKLVDVMIKEARALEVEGKKVVEARSKKVRTAVRNSVKTVKGVNADTMNATAKNVANSFANTVTQGFKSSAASALGAQAQEVKARVISTATAVKERAVELFEVRVATPVSKQVTTQTQKVLGAFGVPTSQSIKELTTAVEALRKNVEVLQRRRSA